MALSIRGMMLLKAITILQLFTLATAQTWNEDFPFQWMTDDFSTSGPQSALWSWTSCMLRTPPFSWNDLSISTNAAFLMANNTACYLTPSNSGSNWVLPAGNTQGVAIQVTMHAGGLIPVMPNYLDVPCCHNRTTKVGIEYGVRDVSYANFDLGETKVQVCGCASYTGSCYPTWVKAYEAWSLGSSVTVPTTNYWWQVTDMDPQSYCGSRPTIGAYCTGGCSTVTTIKSIPGVPGQVTVEVPEMPNGVRLAPTNVSTSVVTLALTAARRFQFFRFGSGRSNNYPGYFNSVHWLLGMRDVAIYLPGQCYDNNVANGDGCDSNNFVEPMCRCSLNTNKFKLSLCNCPAPNSLLTAPGFTFGESSFVNPNTQIVVSGNSSQTRGIAYSKRTTFVLHNCPHQIYNCSDTRIARYLRLSINGTWQSLVQPSFQPCRQEICGADRWIIDLAGLFPPFEYGSTLQFVWWLNPKVGSPGGLLSPNGAVFAASPRMTLNKLVPRVIADEYKFIIAGFTSDVGFASNVRDPESVEIFMYEGTVWGALALTNISSSDPFLTPVDSNCTASLFGEPIRHSCTVRVPAPRFPDNNLYLVARLVHGEIVGDIAPINVTVGSNSFIFWDSEPVIAQDTTKTSVEVDATAIRPDMDIKLFVGELEVPNTEVLRTRTSVHFNLTIPDQSDHFAFPSVGSLIVSYSDGNNQVNTTIARVYPTPVITVDSPSYQYFLENDTLLIFGTGFDTTNASSHHVTLIQNEVENGAKCLVETSQSDHLVCRLQRDSLGSSGLQEGAVFAAIRIYDSVRWQPCLVGFYLPISVFEQVVSPDGVDLSTSPKLQFRLNASLPGRQTPPDWNTVDSIYALLGQLFGISNSTDLFSNFAYKSSSMWTTYDLEIWFTSTTAATIYNQRGIASNFTLMAEIQQIIVDQTGGIYNVTLLSSSVSRIDPSWPYLVFKLTIVNPARISPPTRQEITVVRSVAATLWSISSTGLFGQSRASVDGSGYEFTLYFIDSASRASFLQYKLPINESVTSGQLDSIIASATNNDFSSTFLRGSSYSAPAAMQVDVSWPWMRFLLTSTADSAPPTGPSTEQLDAIQQGSSRFVGVTNQDVFLQLRSTMKRAVGDQFLLTLYFSSSASQRAFADSNLVQNQTFISGFNALVSNSTGGAFNSSFLTDSTAAVPSDSSLRGGQVLPLSTILAIVIPIAVVAIVIVVVFVVIFRRRYAQLKRIEQSVEKLPEELKSVLSIKSGEITLGSKLGEGSFGAVFRAKFRGKQVAVKQLSANMLSSQIADFFREASTMMAIKLHRNVVRMIGMCQELGNFSMVMEYCSEGSLDHLLHDRGIDARNSLSEAEIYKWARGIALGMRHLAASGIVHRDLAARNILLDSNLVPKISDFGFSRVIGANSTGKTNATIGPIRWMSPENIRDQSYSEKSDVWAYGATLVELITGDEPFPGMSPVECGVWIRDGVATPLNYVPVGVSVPQWVFTLIGRCFTFDESQRPSFDDVISFLNENVPEGVIIDPNEEAPVNDDGASGKKRKKKHKKNQVDSEREPATIYQPMEPM
eukprot:TRINITY_DN4480_c0_g1_i1.p1 TRINITY_DN4480_c0_g1~~TRINITY_DN4480_c0_g1_i1.p1  ORF type:complete len:1551 (+),score=222.69 TRINITY_DN4480_c0_g1_i1:79-4731(+)